MISRSELEALAKQPKKSATALDARLTDLRVQGGRILECIRYVFLNQGCSLSEAMDIVVNSSGWIDQKEAFLRHQQDMFEEFLEANPGRIESIHQTITPDSTKMVVHMKPPVQPWEDTTDSDTSADGRK